MKRKDAIIRVRNAQIAALWNELHVKEPWRNALQAESRIGLPEDKLSNETRALAVIAINSVRLLTFYSSFTHSAHLSSKYFLCPLQPFTRALVLVGILPGLGICSKFFCERQKQNDALYFPGAKENEVWMIVVSAQRACSASLAVVSGYSARHLTS